MATCAKSHPRINANNQITGQLRRLLPGRHYQNTFTDPKRLEMDLPTAAPVLAINRCERGWSKEGGRVSPGKLRQKGFKFVHPGRRVIAGRYVGFNHHAN